MIVTILVTAIVIELLGTYDASVAPHYFEIVFRSWIFPLSHIEYRVFASIQLWSIIHLPMVFLARLLCKLASELLAPFHFWRLRF